VAQYTVYIQSQDLQGACKSYGDVHFRVRQLVQLAADDAQLLKVLHEGPRLCHQELVAAVASLPLLVLLEQGLPPKQPQVLLVHTTLSKPNCCYAIENLDDGI
jgi:hypothetical protein